MTAPNMINTSNVTGKTNYFSASSVFSNVLVNATSSNTIIKINDLMLTNYSGGVVTSSVVMNRSGTNYYLASNLSIPSNSTLTLLAKDTIIYVEEGDYLQANVSSNNSVHITSCYEIIS